MGKLSVNQVRIRLGKIMEVVTSGVFKAEYESIAAQAQIKDNAADVMAAHLQSTESYLKFIAKNLSNSISIVGINSFTHPLVIFSVGIRYHWITCALIEKDQDEVMIVPDSDREFFLMMFVQFFNDQCLS